MKLLYILKEGLYESKPITLGKDVYPQIEKLYDVYMDLLRNEKEKISSLEGIDLDLFLSPKKENTIKIGTISINNPYGAGITNVEVYVGYFIGDERKAGAFYARPGIAVINAGSEQNMNKSNFRDNIYHELVHGVDPKIQDKSLSSNTSYNNILKSFIDKSNPHIVYLKRPEEFDAFSSSFINNLSDSIDSIESEESKKAVKRILREFINKLLSIQKDMTPTGKIDSKDMSKKFFELWGIIKPLYMKNIISDKVDSNIFMSIIRNMLFYMHKPTMFKKYIQRLATLL